MARGKYLSLEEARKTGKLKQFAKEHELDDPRPDGWSRFWTLLDAAARGKPKDGERK